MNTYHVVIGYYLFILENMGIFVSKNEINDSALCFILKNEWANTQMELFIWSFW